MLYRRHLAINALDRLSILYFIPKIAYIYIVTVLVCCGVAQVRLANRVRQRERPVDPVDLDFELADRHIPAGYSQV